MVPHGGFQLSKNIFLLLGSAKGTSQPKDVSHSGTINGPKQLPVCPPATRSCNESPGDRQNPSRPAKAKKSSKNKKSSNLSSPALPASSASASSADGSAATLIELQALDKRQKDVVEQMSKLVKELSEIERSRSALLNRLIHPKQ